MSNLEEKLVAGLMPEGEAEPPSEDQRRIYPVPSLAQRGPWHVEEDYDHCRTDKAARHMQVPTLVSKGASFSQLDELSHVAYSPPNPGEIAGKHGVSIESVLALEDNRMRAKNALAGINVNDRFGENEIMYVKKTYEMLCAKTVIIDADETTKEDGAHMKQWKLRYWAAIYHASQCRIPKARAAIIEIMGSLPDTPAKREVKTGINYSIQATRADGNRGPAGTFIETINWAKYYDELRKDRVKVRNREHPPMVDGFTTAPIQEIDLNINATTFRVGRSHVFRQLGSVPRKWANWPTNRRVFEKRTSNASIAIVMDGSGSMGYTTEDFAKFFRYYPACKALVYSGQTVMIVANDRRYANPDDWVPQLEGANQTDYFALTWLANQDVDQRYFISDGQVSLGENGGGKDVKKFFSLAKAANIIRVSTMSKLLPVIKGTRKPCKYILPPHYGAGRLSPVQQKELYGFNEWNTSNEESMIHWRDQGE